MADGVVQVAPDSTGKRVDTSELTVNALTVERQRVQLAGNAATDLSDITNGAPLSSDFGLITRPLLYDANGNAIVQKAIPTGGAGQIAIPVWTNAIQAASYVIGATIVTAALTAATRKDVLVLTHVVGATKTVKIRSILVGGFQTTALAGSVQINLFRGTAAPSGGSAATLVPTNPGTGAAEATAVTLPTSVTAATSLIATTPASLAAAANTGWASAYVWQWFDSSDIQPITLRAGNLDTISLAVQSTAAQNLTLSVLIVLTEE